MESGKQTESFEATETVWLIEVQRLAEAVALMSETLAILNTKRETLEEKMIKSYFHKLSISSCDCMQKVHQVYQSTPQALADRSIEEIHTLNEDLGRELRELLKIVRYNLNFLEQYFEYDFNARLHNDFLFQERLEKVIAKLDPLLRVQSL